MACMHADSDKATQEKYSVDQQAQGCSERSFWNIDFGPINFKNNNNNTNDDPVASIF